MEPENQHIEWKESWKDNFLKHICAFANSKGGKLLIGITDKGIINGVTNPKKLLEDIPNKVLHLLEISVEVRMLLENEKPYIEIVIAESRVPVSYRGVYYIRSGSTTRELKGAGLRQFILRKDNLTWDEICIPDAGFDELDKTSLQRFIQQSVIANRMMPGADTEKLKTILKNLDLINDKGEITRAALILFGKRPNKYFRNMQFKIGQFSVSASDLVSQDSLQCNAFDMPDRIMELLRSKYLRSTISYQGLQRVESLEYSEAALREAILNSIIHRDFSIPADITLSIFDNRISIWNPGALLEPLDIEMLKISHPSLRRNPLIANVFFRAGYIEAWGRGTLAIINETRKHGAPEPEFKEYAGGFELTFRAKYPREKIENHTKKIKVSPKQLKALEYLANNQWITNVMYQHINQCSRNIATKDLRKLFVLKLIVREGKGRYTKYKLK